jgi:hypothetical protein
VAQHDSNESRTIPTFPADFQSLPLPSRSLKNGGVITANAPISGRLAILFSVLGTDIDAAPRQWRRWCTQNFTSTEEDEPSYFAYSATLRIHGSGLPLDEITKCLGVELSHQHRQGDQHRPGSRPYRSDAWHFAPAVAEERELTEHLRELWRWVQPHAGYLLSLDADVDVFCDYRSNNGASGFAVQPDALEIFRALNIHSECR